MTTNSMYPDKLALYMFQAGYDCNRVATMLTGTRPGTPEHEKETLAIERIIRQAIIDRYNDDPAFALMVEEARNA